MNKKPLQLMIGALALGVAASLPARAAERPVRWNTGGAVWSTTQDAFDTFFQTGEVVDRGLEGGLRRSGWTAEEVRQGMLKPTVSISSELPDSCIPMRARSFCAIRQPVTFLIGA